MSVQKNTFKKVESYSYDRNDHNFDPEWIEYSFSMVLECAVAECKRRVVCVGTGGVEQQHLDDNSGSWGWFEYYVPTYFEPPLKIFMPPENTPQDVLEALGRSFSIFFSNPASSLTNLRFALETLLDVLGVTRVNEKGRYLNLAGRIALLDEKHKAIVLPAEAIRFLGNDGTHANVPIRKSHVLDGYAIFEHILEQLYPKGQASVEALIEKINADRGINAK